MKKQEFYQAMEICDINNRFSDTNNNYYYRWKDADWIFIICDENGDNVSVKVLGEISYDFIEDFYKKNPTNNITVSDVYDSKEKDNDNTDNKCVSYAMFKNLIDILKFIREKKISLAKEQIKESCETSKIDELLESINSSKKEQDIVSKQTSKSNNVYNDPYADKYVREQIGEMRAQLPIRGRWAPAVRKEHRRKAEEKRKRKNINRPLWI